MSEEIIKPRTKLALSPSLTESEPDSFLIDDDGEFTNTIVGPLDVNSMVLTNVEPPPKDISIPYDPSIEDYVPILMNAIDEIRENGSGNIILESGGTYMFQSTDNLKEWLSNHDNLDLDENGDPIHNSYLRIKDVNNLTIKVNGTLKAKFLGKWGKNIGVSLINCNNVTIENVEVDFENPYFGLWTVAADEEGNHFLSALTPNTITRDMIQGDNFAELSNIMYSVVGPKTAGPDIEPGFTNVKLNSSGLLVYKDGAYADQKVYEYQIKPRFYHVYAGPNEIEYREGVNIVSNEYGNPPSNDAILGVLGRTVVTRSTSNTDVNNQGRPNPGLLVYDSDNIRLINCGIYAAAGMGVLLQSSRNIYVDGMKTLRKDSEGNIIGRPAALEADGIHCSNCGGYLDVKNSEFEMLQDDALNIHATVVKVKTIERGHDGNKILCEFMHAQTRGVNIFHEGDTVRFYNRNTYDIISTQRVKKVERNLNVPKYVTLTFDDLPIGVDTECAVESANLQAALTFENNLVRTTSKARGILITLSQPAKIINNTFQDIWFAPIYLEGNFSNGGWWESGPCRNMVISGNEFINCCYKEPAWAQITIAVKSFGDFNYDFSAQKIRYHQNIEIKNNTFREYNGKVFRANNCKTINIHDNTYYGDVITELSPYAEEVNMADVVTGIEFTETKTKSYTDTPSSTPITGTGIWVDRFKYLVDEYHENKIKINTIKMKVDTSNTTSGTFYLAINKSGEDFDTASINNVEITAGNEQELVFNFSDDAMVTLTDNNYFIVLMKVVNGERTRSFSNVSLKAVNRTDKINTVLYAHSNWQHTGDATIPMIPEISYSAGYKSIIA